MMNGWRLTGLLSLLLGAMGLRRGGWRVYVLAAVVLVAAAVVSFLFFYPGFWSLLLLALGTAALLHFTVLGRYCYAIGSNEATARLCGVPVERNRVVLYTLTGLLTGVAGVLMFAKLGMGDPNCAKEQELWCIAAVVIGGASLSGGQGTVVGTLLGVLILAILNNGVSNFNVPVEAQYIVVGVIIVANTALSQWQRRRYPPRSRSVTPSRGRSPTTRISPAGWPRSIPSRCGRTSGATWTRSTSRKGPWSRRGKSFLSWTRGPTRRC